MPKAIDKDLQKKLRDAVTKNKINNTREYLSEGANPNISTLKGRNTLLHRAVERSYVNIVELLLQYGAEIDKKNLFGFTPLHEAVMNINSQNIVNRKSIISSLLKKGANILIKDKFHRTPGILAADNGYLKIAEWLHPAFQVNYDYTAFSPDSNLTMLANVAATQFKVTSKKINLEQKEITFNNQITQTISS